MFIAAGGLAPAFASAEEHCFEWCMSSPCDDLSGNSLPYEGGACGSARLEPDDFMGEEED